MAEASPENTLDVVIVGAGFAGMYALHSFRGMGLQAKVLEAGNDVGGTWYWNRYPGARCDVESMQYSYSFDESLQQDWQWPEKFSAQPDILSYACHVADRFDLRRSIDFDTSVIGARYDANTRRWQVATDKGEQVTARFVVMATGCISTAQIPKFDGLSSYRGNVYHTGEWPHEKVDFTGQRVAVIGTGSSGIQAIPVIAQQAAHLTVFQRTANYSLPSRNCVITPRYEHEWKSAYSERRKEMRYTSQGALKELNDEPAMDVSPTRRHDVYEARWASGGSTLLGAFNNLLTDGAANETAADFVRKKIREIVKDIGIAELLCPNDHPIGTKRICIDSNYYQTFNRDNVDLVDVSTASIDRLTQTGIETNGQSYTFDSIVFATGFDAMTGALFKIDICGRRNLSLKEKWHAGPRNYLGLMSNAFPNLFTITGPGSPSVKGNMLNSIEQHVDLVTTCIDDMRARDLATIEPTLEAEDEWVAQVQETANRTLFPQANSWYMGANIPGKPRLFMPYIGGVGRYRIICEEMVTNGYSGFSFEENRNPVAAGSA